MQLLTRDSGPGAQRRRLVGYPRAGAGVYEAAVGSGASRAVGLGLLALATLAPRPGLALEASLRGTARGFAQRIPEEVLFSRLRTQTLSATTAAEQLSAQLHLIGYVESRPVPALGLRLGLDTGLLEVVAVKGASRFLVDGRSFEERFPETLFLGETYVELELGDTGWVELKAGKLRPRVGAGAIFDAYGLGLTADVDLSLLDPELPYSVRLHALLPDGSFTSRSKQSPFVALEAGVRLGRAGIRLLGAALWDGDDGAVPVLRDAATRGGLERLADTRASVVAELRPALRPAAERIFDRLGGLATRAASTGSVFDLATEGWLGWTGALLTYDSPTFEIEAVALLGFGELDVDVQPSLLFELIADREAGPLAGRILDEQRRSGRVPLLSGLGQVTFRLTLFEEVDLSGFLLAMTGDTGLRPDATGEQRYASFVGLAPLITHTSLFFDGGVSQSLASPTVASPAPDGAGLLSGGLFVDAFPNAWLHVRSGLALMASAVPSAATGGRLFGVEADLLLDALIGDRLLAYLDLSVLAPLDYYGELEPGLQAILGLSALFEGP